MGLKSKLAKCVNVPQIKALLWKDVLIKKRQPVSVHYAMICMALFCILICCFSFAFCLQWMTALQFFWPCAIFLTLFTLRWKFSATDMPDCQFPTRQLVTPTTLLPFFQSYICTIENECTSPKKYEEISEFEAAP